MAAVRPGRSRRILRRPAPRHRVPAWWNPYVQPQRRRAFKPPRDGSGGATLLRDERRVVAARRLLLLVDRRLGIARIYLSGRLVGHPFIHLSIHLPTYPSTALPIHLSTAGCSASGDSAPTNHRRRRPPLPAGRPAP